jgi:hypothetical protein
LAFFRFLKWVLIPGTAAFAGVFLVAFLANQMRSQASSPSELELINAHEFDFRLIVGFGAGLVVIGLTFVVNRLFCLFGGKKTKKRTVSTKTSTKTSK